MLLTAKVWKGVCVSYFHEDPPGKPGQNSERVSLLIDDFSDTLGHILTEILSQRKRFHPFGMEVSQGHDVRVLSTVGENGPLTSSPSHSHLSLT